MVIAEAEDCCHRTDEETKEDIETMMPEIRIARRRNVDGGEEGDDGEDEEINGRRCSLVASCNDCVVVS